MSYLQRLLDAAAGPASVGPAAGAPGPGQGAAGVSGGRTGAAAASGAALAMPAATATSPVAVADGRLEIFPDLVGPLAPAAPEDLAAPAGRQAPEPRRVVPRSVRPADPAARATGDVDPPEDPPPAARDAHPSVSPTVQEPLQDLGLPSGSPQPAPRVSIWQRLAEAAPLPDPRRPSPGDPALPSTPPSVAGRIAVDFTADHAAAVPSDNRQGNDDRQGNAAPARPAEAAPGRKDTPIRPSLSGAPSAAPPWPIEAEALRPADDAASVAAPRQGRAGIAAPPRGDAMGGATETALGPAPAPPPPAYAEPADTHPPRSPAWRAAALPAPSAAQPRIIRQTETRVVERVAEPPKPAPMPQTAAAASVIGPLTDRRRRDWLSDLGIGS